MDYIKIYNAICNNAKTRITDEYTESHHIMPRSMGGSNDPDNLVDLTGREHFIVHKILAKVYKGPMIYAFMMMCNTSVNEYGYERFKVSSRDYALARKMISDKLTGVKRTKNTKTKISESQKLRLSDPINRIKCATRTGIPNTEEQKRKISEKLKGVPKQKYPPCPYCGKICNKATAVRWHYSNCKMRT
ncbi:homing endonuclease [Providencia phage PSTRCR_121]|nr:homing endonuclease [Providencia phage PSTRCR_121]